ncbi:MAG: PKD domain-containing protein, partial [Sciscionella sp.]
YNTRGQVVESSVPYYTGDTEYWTTYQYDDPLNRVTQVVTPATGGGTATTQYTYYGLSVWVADPRNGTTTTTKNPLGQITDIADPAGNHTEYVYKPFNELYTVTAADGKTTTLGYDLAGHRTSLMDADRGSLSFENDSLGDVTQEENANSQYINLVYDALGRLTQRTFPAATSGTETQSWSYWLSGNGAGQLESESDSYSGYSFTRTLDYDSYGELSTQTDTLNSNDKELTFTHDTLGRLASVTYPDVTALQVDYSYDTSGSLYAVTNHADGTVYWQPQSSSGTPDMNAFGQMEHTTLGTVINVKQQHDAATGAITLITSGPNTSTGNLNLGYGYDVNGNTHIRQDNNSGMEETFGYDGLNRLSSVTSNGNPVSSFTYSAAGQFTQGPAGLYQYDDDPNDKQPAHSPISTSGPDQSGTYSYDDAGQRQNWSTTTDDNLPIAEASASPTNVTSNQNVTLDSTGSYDPDAGPDPLTYHWSQTLGPDVSITNPDSATTTVPMSINGHYQFELTVSDGANTGNALTGTVAVAIPSAIPTNLHFDPATNPITSGSSSYNVEWD